MASTPQGGADAGSYLSPARRWFWIFVLVLAMISSYLDRQILSLMVDPIRKDLQISDTQFGLLSGLSFALLYCTLAVPIGGLVDRYSRKAVLFVGVLGWSVMTSLCGLTSNFAQLFLTRVGVGVGEATLSPSAYSVIADCFPPRQIARALSIFVAGGALGVSAALMGGGLLIEAVTDIAHHFPGFRPWQIVFILVGLTGLPLLVLLVVVREPPRRQKEARPTPSWTAVFDHLRRNGGFWLMFWLAGGCMNAANFAMFAWTPAYIMRVMGETPAQVGIGFGLVVLIAVPLGLAGGARLAEKVEDRTGRPGAMTVLLVSLSGSAIAGLVQLASGGVAMAYAAVTVMMFFINVPFGVNGALVQRLTPSDMRGRVSAIYLFVNNITGMLIGPLIPALINDGLFKADPLRTGQSLGITVVFFCLAALVFLAAARRHADRTGVLETEAL